MTDNYVACERWGSRMRSIRRSRASAQLWVASARELSVAPKFGDALGEPYAAARHGSAPKHSGATAQAPVHWPSPELRRSANLRMETHPAPPALASLRIVRSIPDPMNFNISESESIRITIHRS